ncbi:MAG: hypothetical protein Q9213_001548 [Squamulea squamosa]
MDGLEQRFAKRRSIISLRRKRSEISSSASMTPSDQRPREEKAAPYRNANYTLLLQTRGNSYLKADVLGISDSSKRLCQNLLGKKHATPRDTIFRDDDSFLAACIRLEGKNEARILKDLTPLLVPSAESLSSLGAKHLDSVVESVNEGWNNCLPVTKPRPQPDYALGYARDAFSQDQLGLLQPFIGDPTLDVSLFMATWYMYFPFLACEVKCGSEGLNTADRQNGHSLTVAVRGVVELFRAVKREQELQREILGFSYSHDHESIRIWGHYPVIEGENTTFFRHPICKFFFTDPKEKWTAYNFTKSIYDIWVTLHIERIRSAIDDLPANLGLEGGHASEPHASEITGLSQPLEQHALAETSSLQSNRDLQQITPETSTQMDKPATKKKKRKS